MKKNRILFAIFVLMSALSVNASAQQSINVTEIPVRQAIQLRSTEIDEIRAFLDKAQRVLGRKITGARFALNYVGASLPPPGLKDKVESQAQTWLGRGAVIAEVAGQYRVADALDRARERIRWQKQQERYEQFESAYSEVVTQKRWQVSAFISGDKPVQDTSEFTFLKVDQYYYGEHVGWIAFIVKGNVNLVAKDESGEYYPNLYKVNSQGEVTWLTPDLVPLTEADQIDAWAQTICMATAVQALSRGGR